MCEIKLLSHGNKTQPLKTRNVHFERIKFSSDFYSLVETNPDQNSLTSLWNVIPININSIFKYLSFQNKTTQTIPKRTIKCLMSSGDLRNVSGKVREQTPLSIFSFFFFKDEILFAGLNYKSTQFVTPAKTSPTAQHTAHSKPAKKEALRMRRSGPCSENARLGLQSWERPTWQNVKYTSENEVSKAEQSIGRGPGQGEGLSQHKCRVTQAGGQLWGFTRTLMRGWVSQLGYTVFTD